MDNRLDFIDKFKDRELTVREMSLCRAKFREIDEALRLEGECAQNTNKPAMARAVANARTRLEESLGHAIKALCLKHEAPYGDTP